jgi:hypothetical protein
MSSWSSNVLNGYQPTASPLSLRFAIRCRILADISQIRGMPKGPQGQKRPADMNQLAKAIVDIATGEAEESTPARGRAGGLSGGEARARTLTPDERREIAKKAAKHRWGKGRAVPVKKEPV